MSLASLRLVGLVSDVQHISRATDWAPNRERVTHVDNSVAEPEERGVDGRTSDMKVQRDRFFQIASSSFRDALMSCTTALLGDNWESSNTKETTSP